MLAMGLTRGWRLDAAVALLFEDDPIKTMLHDAVESGLVGPGQSPAGIARVNSSGSMAWRHSGSIRRTSCCVAWYIVADRGTPPKDWPNSRSIASRWWPNYAAKIGGKVDSKHSRSKCPPHRQSASSFRRDCRFATAGQEGAGLQVLCPRRQAGDANRWPERLECSTSGRRI